MIKRRDHVRHLAAHGCLQLRRGGRHDVRWQPSTLRRATVPRHREIPRGTALAICRQLGVPPL
jgi:mRNA interferase HicA